MTLPKINKPTYNDTFPNSKTNFKYRPFDSEEQKRMLIASQGGTDIDVLQNLVDVMNDCTFNKLDLGNRAICDLEKVFLSVRSKSVGEVIEISYVCNHIPDEEGAKPCKHNNNLDVYFTEDVKFAEQPSQVIDISDDIKIKLKYMTINDIINDVKLDEYEGLFQKVEFISNGDEVYSDFSVDEFIAWAKDIPPVAMQRISDFFELQSVAVLKIPTKCKKCKTEQTLTITGALNFFA